MEGIEKGKDRAFFNTVDTTISLQRIHFFLSVCLEGEGRGGEVGVEENTNI